ncbi:MAG: FIST N-terminal domain-containing protein [Candidatus Woesearchaeota archaeon]
MSNNPNCKWVGCTTTGELSNAGLSRGSAVAMVITSQYIHFGVGVCEYNPKNPFKTGSTAAQKALQDLKLDKYLDPYLQFTAFKNKEPTELIRMEPYIFMTLFPGTTAKYYYEDDLVLDGIVDVTGSIPLIGGSAGDDSKFIKTYTFVNGKVTNNGCIVVAIVSNLITNIGIKHGYYPTNKIVLVTKSKGKVVNELNNKPAAIVYSELTGIPLDELKKNPLPYIVTKPFGLADTQGNYWVKTVLKILDDNSLLFFAPIKESTALCIMESNEELILNASKEAIQESVEKVSLKDLELLIIFSCGARTVYLGQNLIKEYQLIKKTIGKKPFIGFYTYAEQGRIPNGPIGAFGQTFLCMAITNKLFTD